MAAAHLLAFYAQPEDTEAFERQYFEEHVPLAKQMPGLKRFSVVKLKKNVMGGDLPYYMMATLEFDSLDALKAAMGSPEGQKAGANLMSFADPGQVTMCSSEVPEQALQLV